MTANKWQRAIAVVCVMSFLVTSCTSLDRISIPGAETAAALPSIQVGQSVVVKTRQGEEKRFKVTAVEADALAGKGVRVLYTDMASLSVKNSDGGKTAIAVALVVLGILIVVGADALGDGVGETIDAIGD
jgi:hypothetical protein